VESSRDCFAVREGLRLHWLEWGNLDQPVLLLLHGSLAHAHWWDVFASAACSEYRVLAPDLRGHGDSDHASAYGMEEYLADLAFLVERTAAPSLRLVGHSLGGLIAANYAARHPGRVGVLVLVDIRLRHRQRSRRFLDRLRQFPCRSYRTREEALQRFQLLPTATNAERALLEHVARHSLREFPDGRWGPKCDRSSLGQALPDDLAGVIRQLSCPVLFVRGANSTVAPATVAAEIRSLLPHARVAEIDNAYHHVMLDNPQQFFRVVREFLLSASGGALRRPTHTDPAELPTPSAR